MEKFKYSLLVFLGGCSYGVVATFVKFAYHDGFTMQEITGAHYSFGVTFLWLATFFVKKDRLTGKQWLFFLLSGLPLGLTSIFYNYSLQFINASFAIILLLQFSWLSIVLRFIFLKEKPANKSIIAIVIVLIGTILAAGIMENGMNFSLYGATFALLAAVSFASFIFISGYNKTAINPIYKSAIMATGGAIFVLTVMPPTFLFNGSLVNGLAKYGFCVSLFSLLIPTIFFNIGMPKIGTLGSILATSELPMAIIMSTLFLGEKVTLIQWLGVVLILAGIIFPNYQPNNERKNLTKTKQI